MAPAPCLAGRYHGSVHFLRGASAGRLYYLANVYSAIRAGRRNGVPLPRSLEKRGVHALP